MNYKLYKAYNLLCSAYKVKQTSTRLFHVIRAYAEFKYLDYSTVKYCYNAYDSMMKFSFETFNKWIDTEYSKEYDNLLLDIIYHAPLLELAQTRGFGKVGMDVINKIREERI